MGRVGALGGRPLKEKVSESFPLGQDPEAPFFWERISNPERLGTKPNSQGEGLVEREDQPQNKGLVCPVLHLAQDEGVGKEEGGKGTTGVFVGNEVTSPLILELDWPGLLCHTSPKGDGPLFLFF